MSSANSGVRITARKEAIVNTSALGKLNVIEWSQSVSGSYCGKLFGDMGARVIKVEKPGLGDETRRAGPYPGDIPHLEKSGLFLFLNTNKLGVTLNLETAAGVKIFRELVSRADLLIESNPPEDIKRLGLEYKNLHNLNTALVMISITPFGQTGPYRDYKSSDLINYSMSGNAYNNPGEGVDSIEQPPLKVPMHMADFLSGATGAAGAMSAIMTRYISGLGQHIDLSEQEALASVARLDLYRYCYTGVSHSRDRSKRRGGNRVMYPCKDGYVAMSLIGNLVWPGLAKMIGNPDWTKEEWFQDNAKRAENVEKVTQMITGWMREHTMAEISQAAQHEGVPCSPVRTMKDLDSCEQLAARNFFIEIEHPEAGMLKYPGAPYKLSTTPWAVNSPAPLLGEHNEHVYCQMLNYTRQDLVKMRQAGVI
jgi:crotonobetainyl-CoA:carnitine CoA-transferase CaiB-like acyl-CoA transferase